MINPDRDNGSCRQEDCPEFDGKRCRVMGCTVRAGYVCEPYYKSLRSELALAQRALEYSGGSLALYARVSELEAALRGMIDDWGICHLESTDALARAFEVLGLQGGTGPRGAA